MNNQLLLSLSIASLFITAPVSATVIPFSDLNLADYGKIDQNYGDNVDSENDGVGSYFEGNGFTPNVTMSYQTTDDQNVTVEDWLEYWSTHYGDLTDVAYPGQNGHYAEITLTPESGYQVRLNGFDMAGWSQTDQSSESIQVLDANGDIIWDSDVDVVHGTGPTHDHFAPNVSSNSEITIRWGANWNIGIDNIDFDQSASDESELMSDCVATYKSDGRLNIPCINVSDVFGGNNVYQADFQLMALSSPLSFELTHAQLQQKTSDNDECVASYTGNSLTIPCVSVSDPFSGNIMYQVEMQLIPSSDPLAFEVTDAQQK